MSSVLAGMITAAISIIAMSIALTLGYRRGYHSGNLAGLRRAKDSLIIGPMLRIRTPSDWGEAGRRALDTLGYPAPAAIIRWHDPFGGVDPR